MADIPPPPPGFTLDKGSIPPPPEGFTLDAPTAPADKKPVMYGRGQLPIPDSKQTLITQQDLLDSAMMVPAVGVEGLVAKGIEKLGGAAIEKLAPSMLKNAVAGGAGGATYGAGTGRDVATTAAIGAGGGAAAPLIGKAFGKEAEIPTAKGAKAESTALYGELPESKSTLTPAWTDKFLTKIDQFKPQTEVGKLFVGDNEITQLIDRAQLMKGKPISLQAAMEIDENLSEQISKHYGVTGLDKQGQKIMEFQDEFRESMHPDNLHETDIEGGKEGFEKWRAAQAKWSDAAKMRDIEKIMTRAGQADNPATAMKTGFRTLYNNQKRMRSFSPEERALIKDAAEGHFTDNFLKIFASRLRPIIASSGGGMAGTAGAYATSSLARGAAEKLQFNRAMKIINEISREKPLKSASQAIGAEDDPLAAVNQYYKEHPESASQRWNP